MRTLIMLLACVILCGCDGRPREAAAQPAGTKGTAAAPAAKTWTRQEIREWVGDGETNARTEKELKEKFGPPKKVIPISSGDLWQYEGLSVDKDGTGKVDSKTIFKIVHPNPVRVGSVNFVP